MFSYFNTQGLDLCESDLGGMGGLSVGWYFFGKGGLLVVEVVNPLG